MIRTNFFTKKSLLALGLSLWAVGAAEDLPNDGKHWYTAKPGRVAVDVVDQIKLRCTEAQESDSVLWQINGTSSLFLGNTLEARTNLIGQVYHKSHDLWQVDSFAFNGIVYSSDTILKAPTFANTTYIWRHNGNLVSNNQPTISVRNTVGEYTVNIIRHDLAFDTLYYKHLVIDWNGTVSNPIYDNTLIGQDLNHFWVTASNYQYAEWHANGQTLVNNQFLMLEDGSVSLLVQKDGKYYKDVTLFYGIRKDGHLLRANVSAAQYQWYKDGNAIEGATNSFIDLAVHGRGSYKLMATFNTSVGIKTGIYHNYTDGPGTYNNPIGGYGWIQRVGDTLTIKTPANFDGFTYVVWKYKTATGEFGMDSTLNYFALQESATVTAMVLSNGVWYEDKGYFEVNNHELGSFERPIDTTFIEQDAFTLFIPTHLQGDSAIWFVYSKDTLLTKDYIHFGTSVELYNNATVIAHIKYNGLWYMHILDYKGIVLEEESNTLQAPVIKDAQYEWFFNGNALGVYSSSYEPTAAGTYKVVINWVESAQAAANERVAQTSKTATFTFVVGTVTGINDGNAAFAALNLYPNPAQESFVFEGNVQDIEYRIEDTRSVVVKQGQTAAGMAVSVQDLQPGVYMVHMKAGHASTTKRLVIK